MTADKISDRFELTSEKKVNVFRVELFRIKVKKTFIHKFAGEIKEGTLGGWVDSLDRISGDAWVSGNAEVSGNVKIDIKLCSKFKFEFQWQVNEWIKMEEEFKKRLENEK